VTSEPFLVTNRPLVLDYLVCFMGMLCKSLVLLTSFSKLPQKKIGQLLSSIEISSQLYRVLLPIPMWYTYFNSLDITHVGTFLFTSVYLAGKFPECSAAMRRWIATVLAATNTTKVSHRCFRSPLRALPNPLFLVKAIRESGDAAGGGRVREPVSHLSRHPNGTRGSGVQSYLL